MIVLLARAGPHKPHDLSFPSPPALHETTESEDNTVVLHFQVPTIPYRINVFPPDLSFPALNEHIINTE